MIEKTAYSERRRADPRWLAPYVLYLFASAAVPAKAADDAPESMLWIEQFNRELKDATVGIEMHAELTAMLESHRQANQAQSARLDRARRDSEALESECDADLACRTHRNQAGFWQWMAGLLGRVPLDYDNRRAALDAELASAEADYEAAMDSSIVADPMLQDYAINDLAQLNASLETFGRERQTCEEVREKILAYCEAELPKLMEPCHRMPDLGFLQTPEQQAYALRVCHNAPGLCRPRCP
jgi:hypothetical protein